MGFRSRCAAWRVTFLCVAKEKSPKERPPPLVRPPTSGSLGSGKRSGGTTQTVHPCTACVCAVVHDGAPDLVPSPRQTTGGNPEPSAARPVNSPQSIRGNDLEGCYLCSGPRQPYGETKLSPLCNKRHRHGFIEKIIMSTTASGTHPYQSAFSYLRPDSECFEVIMTLFIERPIMLR